MTSYSVTLTQALRSGATFQTKNGIVTTDTFHVRPVPFPARALTMAQALTAHPVLARQYAGHALVAPTIRVVPTLSPSARYKRSVAHRLAMHQSLTLARAIALIQNFTVHDLQVLQRALHVVQGLSAGATPAARAKYHTALTQSLRLRTAFLRFLGGTITQGLSLQPTLSRAYAGHAALVQAVSVQPVFAGHLIFRFDLTQQIDVHETDILRAIYHGALADGINLWVAYVDPGGGFTTWAVNSRTGSITEYQNYVFNSITRMGHRFIGADASGIWELDGDLDGASSIPTRIKSGFMQVSGSKFTSFKAAYLGLRVKDDATNFFLKLHSGDGREYVYAVQPRNMGTTKVSMGKGLRSRYFSFELVTSGADYDLDTLEFVPISSQRRV